MEKKLFVEPNIEVIMIENDEIITSSGKFDPEDVLNKHDIPMY